jgi:ADP-ribosylglycohydrolase
MASAPYRANDTDLITWANRNAWLDGCDLAVEYKQAREEGRVLGALEAQFKALLAVPAPNQSWQQTLAGERDAAWFKQATALVDAVQELPYAPDAPHEPDALADIQAARQPKIKVPAWKGTTARWQKHLHGGFLGRACGCMLGKPVEGWPRASIAITGKATRNWPLQRYFSIPSPTAQRAIDAQNPIRKLKTHGHWTCMLAPKMKAAVEDDDTNYTVIGFNILKKYGANFTALDVASTWCGGVLIGATCTAERVAYRNVLNLVLPPYSARYRNCFREWIGAQIRADFYGYANPGRPERAAEWAWRDASLSHVKNGIYGSMWVAAMLAAAYVAPKGDWAWVIQAGLDQIPATSRLHHDISTILQMHARGESFDAAVALIHARWDELTNHGWCHTLGNAQIVAAALLYGADDFSHTIGQAVMAGLDTDCNGATTGSLWGMMHGAAAIPEHWTKPLHDTLHTGIAGYNKVKISALAPEMTAVVRKLK